MNLELKQKMMVVLCSQLQQQGLGDFWQMCVESSAEIQTQTTETVLVQVHQQHEKLG